MSDPANSRPESAEERAAALLADAARAAHGAQARAEVVLEEFLRPERYHLSEFQRHIIRRLIETLVEAVEGDLRARLLARGELPNSPEFAASLGAAHVPIVWPIMMATGFPDDPVLAAILLRRADEYRILRQLRKSAIVAENGVLDGLMDQPDSAIAASAMRLLIAESRSNDRLDDPHIARGDLTPGADGRLVWTVAAALVAYGEREHGLQGAALETAVAAAAREMIDGRTASAALEGAAMDLAGHLDRHGLVDDALMAEALTGGRLTLYVALLAHKSGLSYGTAWDMVTGPESASHMVLLRHLNVDRGTASRLLVAVARAVAGDDQTGDERAVTWVETYDAMDAAAVEAAIQPWRYDRAYRAALARFETGKSA